jgi:hypothetical protein
MAESRAGRIWRLVARQAGSDGVRPTLANACAAAMPAVDVSGAWVTAVSPPGPNHAMCVTGQVSEQLAELQVTLGEGPCQDVVETGRPVLASDLGAGEAIRRWPGFTWAAQRLGVQATFAFPLRIGAIWVGILGLYRETPGPLSSVHLRDALLLADAATVLLLDGQAHAGESRSGRSTPGGQSPDLAQRRAEIDQATGILTEQLGVSITEAFIRLRAHAYAQNRRLSAVARDIVAHRLRLRPDPHPPQDGRA